jgi:hypothetical protein
MTKLKQARAAGLTKPVQHRHVWYAVASIMPQSDIQPRMEACHECVSFPHIDRVRRRLDDAKLMSANGGI